MPARRFLPPWSVATRAFVVPGLTGRLLFSMVVAIFWFA